MRIGKAYQTELTVICLKTGSHLLILEKRKGDSDTVKRESRTEIDGCGLGNAPKRWEKVKALQNLLQESSTFGWDNRTSI